MGFRHIFPNTGRKAGKQNDGVVKKLLPVFQKQNDPSLSCLPNRFQPDYSQNEHSAYGTLDKDMDDTDIARHGRVPTQELQDTQSLDNATSVSDCSGRESSSDGSKEYSQESIMEKAAVVRDRNLNTESPKGGIALPLTDEHIKSPIKVTQVSTCVLKSSRELAKDLIHTLQYVGDWKLLSLLGTGGMSDVYLAQHTARPATYCALKLTKDYILDHKHLKSDACYQSIVSEWQSFETIRTNEDPKATDTTQMPVGWGQDPVEPTHPPCNATKLKKESAGSLQARIVGKAKGGLPAAYGYGFVKVGSAQHYHGWIAMQLLGWNLHSIATDKKKPLTWSTFYRLTSGMLESVRMLHARGVVHRDIKPANFCLAANDHSKKIYIIDLGFAVPMPCKGKSSEVQFCGTPDFASTNALLWQQCGARDDCESLCYTFYQLWRNGYLPWDITESSLSGLATSKADATDADSSWTPERLKSMAEKRTEIWENLVKQGQVPPFLVSWQLYLSSLTLYQRPDYSLLHKLLRNSWGHWHAAKKPVDESTSDESHPETACGPQTAKKRRLNPLLAAEE